MKLIQRENSFKKEIENLYKRLNQSSFLERDEIQVQIDYLQREIEN